MALFNSLYFSSTILVLSNLSLVLAVYFYDWTVYQILLVYWLESGVIGFINMLKIVISKGPKEPEGNSLAFIFNIKIAGLSSFYKLNRETLLLLFPIHYSIFMYLNWTVIHKLFPTSQSYLLENLVQILTILTVSHIVSFFLNFIGRGEYKEISYAKQVVAPYSRMIVLYLAVFLSAFIISNILSEYSIALWILIVVKIIFDLNSHVLEHKRKANAPLQVPINSQQINQT